MMWPLQLPALLALGKLAAAASTLFLSGTIIAFDHDADGLEVIRDGSLLVTDDRITGVYSKGSSPDKLPSGTETVDVSGKIITPGFIDTHRHLWQTGLKTLGSNTSLVEYLHHYGSYPATGLLTAEDVYLGQLTGIYESLAGGVTTILDHAHHTWSRDTAEAGLQAAVDSGARIFWAYAIQNTSASFGSTEQLQHIRDIALNGSFRGTPTELGIAYDSWSPPNDPGEVNAVISTAKEFNVSVITTHSLAGPWGAVNSPEDLHALQILNTSTPIVISHASFLSATGAQLLRATNQFISITPESEAHYGHTHPYNHLIQDQAALGIDTHFTYSGDILFQARFWLQKTRLLLSEEILNRWQVPRLNPMSVVQAFLLATRNGGLALRRNDLGVIAVGAKADLVVWDGTSPAMLGWNDPVAAVILHASVGDIEHVLVDGAWKKRDGKIVEPKYPEIQHKFLKSAKRLQKVFTELDIEIPSGPWSYSGLPIAEPLQADVLRGDGDGYGNKFLQV
ncbi:amidohydrolase [Lasiosphaeris hirsuta]|uniref:Amidohydrolase n=1 Tax=Lasiosphaeris hirsuta TaxID=260670 RepID=A0AA40AYA6_9PEZI|nr:amidohydrolase [Lasiosphaeris hirsuta]